MGCGIERIELEKISMCGTGWRTGAAVTDFKKIIDPLFGPGGDQLGLWHTLRKLFGFCR
jgi:hypothetical protein